MKKEILSVLMGVVLVGSISSPVFAADVITTIGGGTTSGSHTDKDDNGNHGEGNNGQHGYGGKDDCRDGNKVLKNGHVVCDEKKKDDKSDEGSKDVKGSDDKKTTSNSLLTQIVSLFNKLFGKRG